MKLNLKIGITGENSLVLAYRSGDIKKFSKLIDKGFEVNCLNKHGNSLISEVLSNNGHIKNNKEFFDKLISSDVSLDLIGNELPLLILSITKQTDIHYTYELLKKGSDPSESEFNNHDKNGIRSVHNPPIIECFNICDIKKLKLILDFHPVIEARDFANRPMLNCLMGSKDQNFIKEALILLLKNESLIDYRDSFGRAPIHACANMGCDIDVLKILIENNADVNACSMHGITPLMLSSEKGDVSSLLFLIKNGANLNMQDLINNETAAHCAVKYGKHEILDALLKSGADFSLCDKTGNNVCHAIANALNIRPERKNRDYYLDLLKNNKKLLYVKNKQGQTVSDIIKQSSKRNHFQLLKSIDETSKSM